MITANQMNRAWQVQNITKGQILIISIFGEEKVYYLSTFAYKSRDVFNSGLTGKDITHEVLHSDYLITEQFLVKIENNPVETIEFEGMPYAILKNRTSLLP